MNDRFKFRVWSKECSEYVEQECCDCSIRYNGELECYNLKDTDEDCIYDGYPEDDAIVEQCTGLKDHNGVLIYEGDVVKQFNNHGRLLRVGYIVYNEKEMKYKIREERCPDWNEKTHDFTFHPLKQRLLVIGNIHEKESK